MGARGPNLCSAFHGAGVSVSCAPKSQSGMDGWMQEVRPGVSSFVQGQLRLLPLAPLPLCRAEFSVPVVISQDECSKPVLGMPASGCACPSEWELDRLLTACLYCKQKVPQGACSQHLHVYSPDKIHASPSHIMWDILPLKTYFVYVEFIFHCILEFLFAVLGNPTCSRMPAQASF